MGLCPFHDDRNPSLVISPTKNKWHCLGACQQGGDVISWVMKAERVPFRRAVALLQMQDVPSSAPAPKPSSRPRPADLPAPAEPDHVVLRRVALETYPSNLRQCEEPQRYLERRGLRNAEMVEHFHLGFANRTLGLTLPANRVKEGAVLRAQLQRVGLVRTSGHEHMAGSLTVPVLGEEGEVLELYGRKVGEHFRPGTPLHLYLPARPDGRRGVFNLEALKASKDIILCEAIIDALTFWCAGHRNVTTAYGVEGFTRELRDALIEHQTRRVLIAYDGDDAGDAAARRLAPELGGLGIEVFRVHFPRGSDANAYAMTSTAPGTAFERVLSAAERIEGPRAVALPEGVEAESTDAPRAERTSKAAPVTDEAISNEASECGTDRECASTAPSSLGADGAVEHEEVAMSAKAMPDEAARSEALVAETVAAPLVVEAATRAEASPLKAAPPAAPSNLVQTSAPEAMPPLVEAEVDEDEVRIRLGDRRWRIRGISKNTAYDSLRVNLLLAVGDGFYVDTLELYSARHRAAFLKEAAQELKLDERVIKADITKIILRLEDLVQQRIQQAVKPDRRPPMSEPERARALELLRDPRLLDRILEDFEKAGVVGEENNKLVGYLAAVSRKLDAPLAVIIQSTSAAGKSSLMDAVLRFMPEEERVQYSAMTGQSLFYMGETDLAHRILAIAEEQGVQSAAYALKLLQSQGELTIASTGKDPVTGKMVTHDYKVKGPVMIFLTTTAIEVDEELLNRCLVLTVDEGQKQTSAIHARQRLAQTIEGRLLKEDERELCTLHQNAQRLLEPLLVANPFAKEIRFSSRATRTRRDHLKYLTLIQAITLLHQHQRPIKEVEHRGRRYRYIESTEADIAMANRVAKAVLGHGLDELPPQTRRLLEMIRGLVAKLGEAQGLELAQVRFTRRDVRAHTRWGDTQLKVHLARLEELEYLLVHGGGARRRMVYELAGEAPDYGTLPTPFEPGEPSGVESGRGSEHLVGGWSAPGRGTQTRPDPAKSTNDSAASAHLVGHSEKGLIRSGSNGIAGVVNQASYMHGPAEANKAAN